MKKGDLSKIFIRAYSLSKWQSVSLQELLDRKEGGLIASWFFDKLGLKEGEEITKDVVLKMLNILEKVGIVIYKLK